MMEPSYLANAGAPALVSAAVRADLARYGTSTIARHVRDLVEGHRTLVAITTTGGRRLVVLGKAGCRHGLNGRESRMVGMLCAGHSLKQVAMELGRSLATVSRQLSITTAKLGVEGPVVMVGALAPLAPIAGDGAPPPGAQATLFQHEGEPFVAIGFDDVEAPPRRLLTEAEQAVVELVRQGYSNGAIARARRRSPRTIANQLARTFDKLGVHSRVELVLALQRNPATERA